MRILAIAYACEPNRGSEPGVGWNWINNIGSIEECNLTVITRENNKVVIEKYLETHKKSRINFIYYDLPKKILKHKKGDKNIKLFFTLWQIGVIKYLKKNINLKGFDYIWDFNFGSLSLPTFVYKLNTPYFIGPVSTKKSIPKLYINKLSLKDKIKYIFQQFMRENIWINPIVWKALRKADKIVTCNELSREYLPKNKRNKHSISIFHNGLNQEDFNFITNFSVNERISFVYSGRLIKSKNLDVAICMLEKLKERGFKFTFDIIGNGSEKSHLIKIVKEKGLNNEVTFYNKMPQKELFKLYHSRDFLLFPSLLEISSTTVMEAMSCGLVPICLEITGMEYVTNCKSIIKVPCISPNKDADAMAEKVTKLFENKVSIEKLKKEVYEYAINNFMWRNKEKDVQKMWKFIKYN